MSTNNGDRQDNDPTMYASDAELGIISTRPAMGNDDFVRVPREPTEEMLRAMSRAHRIGAWNTAFKDAYRAMIAAAPPSAPSGDNVLTPSEHGSSAAAAGKSTEVLDKDTDGKLFAAALYVITDMWGKEMGDLQRASLANQIVREIEHRGIVPPASSVKATEEEDGGEVK